MTIYACATPAFLFITRRSRRCCGICDACHGLLAVGMRVACGWLVKRLVSREYKRSAALQLVVVIAIAPHAVTPHLERGKVRVGASAARAAPPHGPHRDCRDRAHEADAGDDAEDAGRAGAI